MYFGPHSSFLALRSEGEGRGEDAGGGTPRNQLNSITLLALRESLKSAGGGEGGGEGGGGEAGGGEA
eukprot:1893886-Rhodomonas_salina.1